MRYLTQCAAALLVALVGCGSQVEPPAATLQTQYHRIEGGMSRFDVQTLLGPGRPLTRADGPEVRVKDLPLEKSQIWQDGQTSLTIVFDDDIVVAKLRAVAPVKR